MMRSRCAVSRVAAAAAIWLLAAALVRGQAPAPAADAIAADALMATVRTLASDEYQGRAAGTDGGAKARAFIRTRFKALGLVPIDGYDESFTFTRKDAPNTPVTGVNLLGRCPGTETDILRKAILLTAHYDHLGVRNGEVYHGADDNASGVAVLLELAAACKAQPFRHDLVVVAFDAEEAGLQGARAFARRASAVEHRFAVNVNLDMVARGDRGEIYIAGTHHTPSLRPILEPVAARAPIKVLFGHDRPGSGHDDWTMQSDHGVFHEAGVPFLYFGVEDHPDYHKPTDTADKINPEFFVRAAGVILDALRALDASLK
jgi:Zn-dependent M28 family amino/carboxypeptidase